MSALATILCTLSCKDIADVHIALHFSQLSRMASLIRLSVLVT